MESELQAGGNKSKAAAYSILSNTMLITFKVIVGIITGSVSILAEAIHSAIDLIAALIAFFSIRLAAKPADSEHNYGHSKIENVSGVIEALLIFIAAIWIIIEAVDKLLGEVTIDFISLGIAVMLISGGVNFLVSSYLFKVSEEEDSIALKADALHLRTDVYTSLGVAAGLLLIQITGIVLFDPLIALFVAALIIKAAYDLTKEAFLPLIDTSLSQEEKEIISSIIEDHHSYFVNYHRLRSRKAGNQRYIDLHLVVPGESHIDEIHSLEHHLEEDIKKELPAAQLLIHTEPCDDDCKNCSAASSCRHKKEP